MAGRCVDGGIASLVELIQSHGSALEYDLLTRTHYSLRDLPCRLDWLQLGAFVKHLPLDSALKSEMEPEAAYWEGARRVPMMLADIYDAVAWLQYSYVQAHAKQKIQKPKPYPRPGVKKAVKTYGRGAIRIKNFNDWWDGD